MDLTKNQKRDYEKYYVESPKDFSPERNKAIIDKTIEDYEKMRKLKKELYREDLGERIEATASYLMHLEKVGPMDAEKYFSRRELARLRGEKILETIKKNKVFGDVIQLSSID